MPAKPRKRAPPVASGLTRDAILAAALAEIDRTGADAFSIRALARRLGVNPNAVAWHVGSRQMLLADVVSLLFQDARPPHRAGETWQDWLRALFARYRDIIRRHPKAAALVGAEIVSNARPDFALVEDILATLARAGCPETRLGDAYCAVHAAMIGFTTQEYAKMPDGDVVAWRAEMQGRLGGIDAAAFPILARQMPQLANRAFVLRWQNGVDAPLDGGFAFFVDCVIAGLEALVARPADPGA